jgi:hypothetical protein
MKKVINSIDKYGTPIAWILLIIGSIWACIDLQTSPYPWAGYVFILVAICIVASTFVSYRDKYIRKRK